VPKRQRSSHPGPATPAFVPPYAASWVDRSTAWIDRLSGPAWAYYLVWGVVMYLLISAVQWSAGTYPLGTFSRVHAVGAFLAPYAIGLIHYLDRSARTAMKSFRPALRGDDSLAISVGFQRVIEYDGVDVTWDVDVPATSGGFTVNATYEEVCTGMTGHTEVVLVVFDPATVTYEELLKVFWEAHDPTQGMRQGNDVGTQYRSGIYTVWPAQKAAALASREAYQAALRAAGHRAITTEIVDAPPFYYAEGYHQQYLAKNPGGYCGLGGTGVTCPGACP